MSDLFSLSKKQFNRIKPYFPLSHGVPRVDDLRVISGIIHVTKRELQWWDAPSEYGFMFIIVVFMLVINIQVGIFTEVLKLQCRNQKKQ